MAQSTLVAGIILIALGLGAYFGTDRSSVTALIPSFIGAILAYCGVLARQPERRKLAMHVAMVVALLGVLGSTRGFLPFVDLVAEREVERPVAAVVQVATSVVCLAVFLAGIKSFVEARRARS